MQIKCAMEEADWDSLALGCLEELEASRLKAHLESGCKVCNGLYAEALGACQMMGASLLGVMPSDKVERRLEEHVGKKQRKMPVPWPWLVTAASVGFAIWVGAQPARERVVEVVREVEKPPRVIEVEREKIVAGAERVRTQVRTEIKVIDPNPELLKRIAELEARPPQVVERIVEKAAEPKVIERERVVKVEDTARVRELERLVEEYRAAFRTVEARGARQVEMAGVDAAIGRGSARAIYSQQGGLLVLAHDLPKLPGERCYQVWILRKGTPSIVSGGLMKTDSAGRGILQSPPTAALRDATGFAITDEPPGGSVVARGKKLLFGAL